MSVAPNGRIDVVWLDPRDNPGTYLSSLYYAYSEDHGESWSANIRLSDEFNPYLGWPQQNKLGDYFHMISDSAGAHLAWAATFGGEQNVYYGRITVPALDISEKANQKDLCRRFDLLGNYPNPFNPSTTIKFRTVMRGQVTLRIFNILGHKVRTLVKTVLNPGEYEVLWDGRDDRGKIASTGVYLYKLESGHFMQTRKMALIR